MENNVFRFKPSGKKPFAPITWNDVKEMRTHYKSHPSRLKVPVNGVNETLEALTVTKSDIDHILSADPTVTEFMIIFAIRHEDLEAIRSGGIGAGDHDKQFFTTVVAGVNASGNLVTTDARDFCDPCPTKCNDLHVVG